jgi:hypothetical protein
VDSRLYYRTVEARAPHVFNHARFANPTGEINSSNFGQISGGRDGRIGQAALKSLFERTNN